MGAYSESPLVIMVGSEDGCLQLGHTGLVPDVPHVSIETWEHLEPILSQVKEACPYSTIVLDSLTTMEQLAHEFVCRTEFNGDWSEKGFLGYYRGPTIAKELMAKVLNQLDDISRTHNTMTLVLAHSDVKNMKNPMGEDFDRYISAVGQRTWNLACKWADAVLFGNFLTVVDKKTGKGVGGTTRCIYTEHTDAYDAKNRYNLPRVIHLPDDSTKAWSTLWSAFEGVMK